VERELAVRRRLAKVYNLQEDDFASVRDHNDYLEVVT
jgi:hypothetical protein